MEPQQSPRIPNDVNHTLIDLIEEQRHHHQTLSFHEKLAEKMTDVASTGAFFWVHLLWFTLWILGNSGLHLGFTPFDPYPFSFLTFVVSLEAIILGIFVLIAQNRLQDSSDRRAELDLHINLLAERESTVILRKLCRIEEQLNIVVNPNEKELVTELIKDTNPVEIFKAIEMIYDKSKKPC